MRSFRNIKDIVLKNDQYLNKKPVITQGVGKQIAMKDINQQVR